MTSWLDYLSRTYTYTIGSRKYLRDLRGTHSHKCLLWYVIIIFPFIFYQTWLPAVRRHTHNMWIKTHWISHSGDRPPTGVIIHNNISCVQHEYYECVLYFVSPDETEPLRNTRSTVRPSSRPDVHVHATTAGRIALLRALRTYNDAAATRPEPVFKSSCGCCVSIVEVTEDGYGCSFPYPKAKPTHASRVRRRGSLFSFFLPFFRAFFYAAVGFF